MANRDHTLDGRIDAAAMQEFLRDGYEKASLRKIAAAAEVTIGAIYTRYRTKDELFCALVQPLIQRIGQTFERLRQQYYGSTGEPRPEQLAASMQMESNAILHLLFDDYDRAMLLLCRSAGSSLETFFDQLVDRKVAETLDFFKKAGQTGLDPRVIRLLTAGQFQMYEQVLREDCSLDDARAMMDAAICYHTGGWLALLGLSGQAGKQEV